MGWTVSWLDEWMSGWLDEWMAGWLDEWMSGWMDEWMSGWMAGWADISKSNEYLQSLCACPIRISIGMNHSMVG